MTRKIEETELNLVAEGTVIEGNVKFDNVTRVHGHLRGDVSANEGSTLILTETGMIEGNVKADRILVSGFIKGDIEATGRVYLSGSARVIGNIIGPSVEIDFGAFFQGKCSMEERRIHHNQNKAPQAPAPSPA